MRRYQRVLHHRVDDVQMRKAVPECPGCLRPARWHVEAYNSVAENRMVVQVGCAYRCGYRREGRGSDWGTPRDAGAEAYKVSRLMLADLSVKESMIRPDGYCEYIEEGMFR